MPRAVSSGRADPTARWRKLLTPSKVRGAWKELLALFPGYDSVATAGDCRFDQEAAQLALDFFPEVLTHVEGDLAGEPLVLEPWQKAIIAALFGWMRLDSLGRIVRRYRECLIYVPRKNGKTPMAAGIGLFVLYCDGEAGQQDYIAAADKEQAGKLFRQAKGMVEGNPELRARFRIYGGNAQAGQAKSIVRKDDYSFLQVISADADTKHGGNTHLALIEELHAQPDRELVDVLTTSTASLNRKSPLVIYITTADFARPSICNEKYDYACKVRDGVIADPGFLPVIYEALPDEDWKDPATWTRANPNLGVSVSREYLERECKKAQDIPAYENTFKRLHLNVRTEQDVRWLPLELWDRGRGPVGNLDGRECFGAIDFGWRDDYAALSLVFPGAEREPWQVLPWFWLPKEGRRDRRKPPTGDFVSEGLVTLTDGNATDIEAIYATLRECAAKYQLREVAYDPANARKQGQDLMEDGFSVFEFIQTKRNYNEPCRFLETLLKEGRLRHGGNNVLRWMASNVTVELNGLGEMMPKKIKSAEKIDGVCALVMALARAMLRPEGSSVYETQGLDFIDAGPSRSKRYAPDEDD